VSGSQTNSLNSLKEVFSFSRAETIALGILLAVCLIGGGVLIYENSRQTIPPKLIFESIESAQAVEPQPNYDSPTAPQARTAAVTSERSATSAPSRPLKLNINTAPAESLALLPVVGEALSRRIVDYRTKHGPFAEVDQLVAVYGIGPKNIERIRPYLICR
jgi:competence ComEA-like helix-hairpin-helix protein